MDNQSKSKYSLGKILLLILFFPIGLSYLIWKQKWSVPARIGGIIVLWLVFIALGSSNGSSKGTTATTTTIPTSTTVVAQATSIPVPTVEQTLQQKLETVGKKVSTNKATVEYDPKEKLATLVIPKDEVFLDETDIIKTSWRYFVLFGQEAFKFDGVDEVSVAIKTDFVDSYGKTSEGNGVAIYMKKDKFQKFSWENLKFSDITEQLKTNGEYYIHASIWNKVKQKDLKLAY